MECVSDGRAALEAFDRHLPSVVLMDLNMPGMDGMQLTELLRGKASTSNVPIVVLTGSGGSREWQHLAKLGADGFLVKPVNGKDIATLLRRVIADRARESSVLSRPSDVAPYDAETIRAGREAVSVERSEPLTSLKSKAS